MQTNSLKNHNQSQSLINHLFPSILEESESFTFCVYYTLMESKVKLDKVQKVSGFPK